MTLGERVKERRLYLGLSQSELAKRTGVNDRGYISKIENGRQIKQSMVVKLADALHTTPSYLMGWADIDGNEITEESQLERLYKETGISEFTDAEMQEIIKYSKYLISLRKERDG